MNAEVTAERLVPIPQLERFGAGLDLGGKVAVVSGAGSGLGRACALGFAAAGSSVVAADIDADAVRRTAQLGEALPGSLIPVCADASDPSDVERTMAAAVDGFGGIDMVVNNAGGSAGVIRPMAEITLEEWQRTLALNATSVFLGCRAAVPHLLRRPGGSIVNVASVSGVVGWPQMSAYSAAKGAVVALTRSAALDYARAAVRINCVCPGTIDTPLIRRNRSEAERAAMAEAHPVGRLASPEEIARVVIFLASPAASFMTGAIVSADGGYVSA